MAEMLDYVDESCAVRKPASLTLMRTDSWQSCSFQRRPVISAGLKSQSHRCLSKASSASLKCELPESASKSVTEWIHFYSFVLDLRAHRRGSQVHGLFMYTEHQKKLMKPFAENCF